MLQHHQRYHLVWQWQISVSSWLSVKPNRGSLTSSRFAASPQAWVTDLRESTLFLASLNGGSNPSIVKSVIQAKNWGSNPSIVKGVIQAQILELLLTFTSFFCICTRLSPRVSRISISGNLRTYCVARKSIFKTSYFGESRLFTCANWWLGKSTT